MAATSAATILEGAISKIKLCLRPSSIDLVGSI
jgi:hypothetical protein